MKMSPKHPAQREGHAVPRWALVIIILAVFCFVWLSLLRLVQNRSADSSIPRTPLSQRSRRTDVPWDDEISASTIHNVQQKGVGLISSITIPLNGNAPSQAVSMNGQLAPLKTTSHDAADSQPLIITSTEARQRVEMSPSTESAKNIVANVSTTVDQRPPSEYFVEEPVVSEATPGSTPLKAATGWLHVGTLQMESQKLETAFALSGGDVNVYFDGEWLPSGLKNMPCAGAPGSVTKQRRATECMIECPHVVSSHIGRSAEPCGISLCRTLIGCNTVVVHGTMRSGAGGSSGSYSVLSKDPAKLLDDSQSRMQVCGQIQLLHVWPFSMFNNISFTPTA